jgi:UDPglucose 6-dehydrogenase
MYEPDLEPLLRKGVENGRLPVHHVVRRGGGPPDVHFLCVGTPQRKGEYAADLRYVDGVVEGLAPHLDRPDPGGREVDRAGGHRGPAAGAAGRAGPGGCRRRAGVEPGVPPRGLAVEDTLHPDRIVVGTGSASAEAVLREVYASGSRPATRSSSPTTPPPSW